MANEYVKRTSERTSRNTLTHRQKEARLMKESAKELQAKGSYVAKATGRDSTVPNSAKRRWRYFNGERP